MKKNLRLNKKCVAERLDDQTIILNIESGTYHETNKTGGLIWEKIEEEKLTRQQLYLYCTSIFMNDSCKTDIDIFLDKMIDKGLIFEE